ncbi:MAG TPA: hypothetical protein VM221_03055 [Armatimonadota bacterium]|nr:hypothetical protein [Armatimonadota bacterium]
MGRFSLTLLVLLWMGLGLTAAGAERSERFGIEWVRKHPFTIMGLTQRVETLDAQQYRAAGLTTLLAWKPREGLFEAAVKDGLPWHYYAVNKARFEDPSNPSPEAIESMKATAKKFYDTYPGCTGWVIWDEFKRPELPHIAACIEWFRSTFPDTLVYSNAYPMGAPAGKYYGSKWVSSGVYEDPPIPYGYDDYLAEYVSVCKPDVLVFDIYPFKDGGAEGPYSPGTYFGSLEAVRACALKAEIPYWEFIQSYERGEPGTGGARPLPSESDLRMQIFSSLAYGFTGIIYFTYDVAFKRGLLEPDGSPSRLYPQAARANAEVTNLGSALRFLTSAGVYYIAGRHLENGGVVSNSPPAPVKPLDADAGKAWGISAIRVKEKGADKDGLVGFFRDDQGGRYFMLVNLWRSPDAPAAERSLTMTAEFAPSVTTVGRLSRATGEPELISVGDGLLKIALPGGTGELFKIGDADFPGRAASALAPE